MKQLTKPGMLRYYITLLVFTLMQTVLWAQESEGGGSSSSTTSETKVRVSSSQADNWYSSPWLWIIGAAVFILLLVALTRGSSNRTTVVDRGASTDRTDRVTVTKTVRRDTDVDPDI